MENEALFTAGVVFVFGLIFGSFFNVVIIRLPKNQSIVWPGSRCPYCNHKITFFENIPLLSYLFLGGRCSSCQSKISIQYPIIEFITGYASLMLWFFIVRPFLAYPHPWWEYITISVQTLSLLILIPVSVIDIYHYIIPDSISLGGLILGILTVFLPGGLTPLQCLLGILAGGGTLYLVGLIGEWILKKEAMGFGDVKLMAFLGSIWGWKFSFLSIMYGSLFGSVIGIVFIRVLPKDNRIPFGPFLGLGAWVTVLFGDKMIKLYIDTINKLFF